MTRYVIQNAQGNFLTGHRVTKIVPVPRPEDPRSNDLVQKFTPDFKSMDVLNACKYDDAKTALDHITHPDLDDAAAFANCKVMEVEFDRHDPQGVRDLTA